MTLVLALALLGAVFSFSQPIQAESLKGKPIGVTSNGDLVWPTPEQYRKDKEAEERRTRAIEDQTREIRRAREAYEEHAAEMRRGRAYDQARKERRAKVRRLRGK